MIVDVRRMALDLRRGDLIQRVPVLLKTKHEQVQEIIRDRVRRLILGNTDEMEARIAEMLTRAALQETSLLTESGNQKLA